jgi:hypothetical protein
MLCYRIVATGNGCFIGSGSAAEATHSRCGIEPGKAAVSCREPPICSAFAARGRREEPHLLCLSLFPLDLAAGRMPAASIDIARQGYYDRDRRLAEVNETQACQRWPLIMVNANC